MMRMLRKIYWRMKKHEHQFNVWWVCKLCGLHRDETKEHKKVNLYPSV